MQATFYHSVTHKPLGCKNNDSCMAVIKLLSKDFSERRKPVLLLGFQTFSTYSHSVLKGFPSIQNGIKCFVLWRFVSIVSIKNKRKKFFVYLLCTSKSGISHNSLVARKIFFFLKIYFTITQNAPTFKVEQK